MFRLYVADSAPEAPSNLRIEEVEGNSLVLAWQPPPLDQHGCSNGCKVVGYRVSAVGLNKASVGLLPCSFISAPVGFVQGSCVCVC